MTNQDTSRKLIDTTKRLLTDGTPLESLTARQISSEAETNLAMINYCFKSKDALLKIAVDEIIAEEFERHCHTVTLGSSAKEQLRELLLHICSAMIKYRELTKLSIPYLMLNDGISLPLDILPYIKMHFGATKSETDCRVIAFQMVYTMQLIFYRAEDFLKYSGINICDAQQMQNFLDMQLNLFLGGINDEK
ncbi:TetR/AcrR family transcriptional regulator [Oscillibacter valericigenes]|jgi:AcrR family transcriptional regulator|uniref:TetR/AcrR family transcriptional regulator n=1 Tax=Oscillibacter ruminantium TaxID=1263547 RepID=UPI00058C2FBA|nr:TetR/AcrR family transcriptional regulator [Oscillibacter ruminantium]MDN0033035.1 TetR/AcrR family transcriptional regulator [Oscillibacter valericigenes]